MKFKKFVLVCSVCTEYCKEYTKHDIVTFICLLFSIQTINLKKPYKTECGVKPLKYFNDYSENACWVERLTDYVVSKCNCKDGFMPGEYKKGQQNMYGNIKRTYV